MTFEGCADFLLRMRITRRARISAIFMVICAAGPVDLRG